MNTCLVSAFLLTAALAAAHAQDQLTELLIETRGNNPNSEAPYASPEPFGQATPFSYRPGPSVPMVSFGKHSTEDLDELSEDLNVLRFLLERNLERSLGKEAPDYKMGIPLLLQSGGPLVQASYIEGYGVLFNLFVQFPLIAPAETPDAPAPAQTDSEWERARRAVYGPGEGERETVRWNPALGEQSARYDASLIQVLKKQALQSLANASNVRHLAPEDSIVLIISGPGNVESRPDGGQPGHPHNSPNFGPPQPRGRKMSGGRPDRATVMAIRIRKSDADALSVKKVSFEEFSASAQVHTYFDVPRSRPSGSAGWMQRRMR